LGSNRSNKRLKHQLPAIKSGTKTSVRWLLFAYKGLELVILSKPFKAKELPEKARQNIPKAKKIGIGVVRVPIR
jgi:hypothetical protein